MSTVSFAVKFYRGEKLKKGFFPIVLQVTYPDKNSKTTSSRIRLGFKAKEYQWDFENDCFLTNDEVNKILEARLEHADKVSAKHFRSKPFDFAAFSKLFKESLNTNFYTVLDKYIEFKRGEDAKEGTIIYYDETIRRPVLNFCGSNVPIKHINETWLEEYGKKYKSAAYFRGLRAVLKFAKKKGYIDDFPFENDSNPDGYSFKHLKNKKDKEPPIAYTEEEIELMKQPPTTKREQKAWDAFFSSYYNFGTNLEDLIDFTDNNKRGNGLHYVRSKTGVLVMMPYREEQTEIIERNRKGKYWYHYIDPTLPPRERKRKKANFLRSVNRTLKNMAKKRGTDTRINFYTARHTAATIAIKKGAPIQKVSALLGHKHISTTQNYLAKFFVHELDDTMNLLQYQKSSGVAIFERTQS